METQVTEPNFWRAISILIKNVHALKKTVFSYVNIASYQISKSFKLIDLATNAASIEEQLLSRKICFTNCDESYVSQLIENQEFWKNQKPLLFIGKILNKNGSQFKIAHLLDFETTTVQLCSLSNEDSAKYFRFTIKLLNAEITCSPIVDDDIKQIQWCRYVLLPKVINWSKPSENGKCQSIKSLSLVDKEDYNNLYIGLKQKYGKSLVDIWCESTDPLKFVYEDIAIASYLIILWKNQPKPISFLDLGCGNGVLVHILNNEGFSGYGIDIRKRKIWEKYPDTTCLKEEAFNPEFCEQYSKVDWIIGNHSDELSPWISVIAALMSPKTKYFLLPCCAYEFTGKKYQRRDCKLSIYNDYLKYLEEVSNICGYDTLIDRLKIPSTKRIALIGMIRDFSNEKFELTCNSIKDFTSKRREQTGYDIKLREKVEAVKNCTQLDKEVTHEITMTIVNLLVNLETQDTQRSWRVGKTLSIADIASKLDRNALQSIKSQCGGLQTFLKMKHEIFDIQKIGVKLRRPVICKPTDRKKLKNFKKRECFFFTYHPDGCPLNSNECSFIH